MYLVPGLPQGTWSSQYLRRSGRGGECSVGPGGQSRRRHGEPPPNAVIVLPNPLTPLQHDVTATALCYIVCGCKRRRTQYPTTTSPTPPHIHASSPRTTKHTMSDFFNNNSSSTGNSNSEFSSGPGGRTQADGFVQDQGQGGAYDNMQSSAQSDQMGGGQGAMGSGVAGGYSGNSGSNNTSSQTGEKKDWLDKGLESLGKKAGFNLVSALVLSVLGWELIATCVERQERGHCWRLPQQGGQGACRSVPHPHRGSPTWMLTVSCLLGRNLPGVQ